MASEREKLLEEIAEYAAEAGRRTFQLKEAWKKVGGEGQGAFDLACHLTLATQGALAAAKEAARLLPAVRIPARPR